MHEDDLQRRIEQLERRLAQLEARLDETAPVSPAPTTDPQPLEPVAPAVAQLTAAPEPTTERAPPPIEPAKAGRGAPPTTPTTPIEPPIASAAELPEPPEPPAVTVPPLVAARPAVEPSRTTPMELVIGGRWMAWVGALGVVVAVGFFLKLAYDRGWWSLLSPATRCAAGAVFGLLLMSGGELAMRRIGRPAAAGLYAAGLATLYLVAWAAFGYFEPPLIGEGAAFVLMAFVAVIGFAITYHTRFLTIGVISMIGGYATPLLVGGISDQGLLLPGFLTMLLAIALGLSLTRPRDFRPLRGLALGGQTLIGGAWLLVAGQAHWEVSIVFMSIWWAMLLGECTVAAIRGQSTIGNIAVTLVATAAYVTGATWVLNAVSPPAGFSWTGIFVGAIAVLGTAVALQFGPGLDALRGGWRETRGAMGKLAIALWVQSGALVAVAIAMQFDGYGQSIGWLAVALASIEMARRLPSRGVGVFGLIVGGLAVARIVLVDSWINPALRTELLTLGADVGLTGWGVLGLSAVAAMHVAARRLGEPAVPDGPFRRWVVWPILLATGGTLLWLGVTAVMCRDASMTTAWLLGAVALLAACRLGRREGYLDIALGALVITAAKWVLLDAAAPRIASSWSATDVLPLLNVQTALAAAIGAAGWWVSVELQRRTDVGDDGHRGPGSWSQLVIVGTAGFLLLAMSFEVDRAVGRYEAAHAVAWSPMQLRALWWTALWAVGGAMLILAGRQPRLAALRLSGWGMLGATAIAWLLVDTIAFRIEEGVVAATPVVNLQFGVGAVLAALLALALRLLPAAQEGEPAGTPALRHVAAAGLALIGAIGFWLGSLEIDRAFAASPMTVQTGLSIYWGLYAVMLIVLGFIRRIAIARYVGIGIFSLTVLKVMAIDMSQVEQIWRVLSCLAVGLLLIGTSVLYTKLAPRLLQ